MPAVKPVTAGKKTAKTYQKPRGAVRSVMANSGVRIPSARAPIAKATNETPTATMIGICSLRASSALLPETRVMAMMIAAAKICGAALGISPHRAGHTARIASTSPKL